jgi:hypothetical protein
VIQPLEFKREYLHNNPSSTYQNTSLETMIDAALKYHAYDNTMYCTLYLMGLNAADIKVLAKYAEAGYSIVIHTAHHCYDTDDIELTVCYHY